MTAVSFNPRRRSGPFLLNLPGAEAHRSRVQGLKELAQADGEPMSTLPGTRCCPAPFNQLGAGSPVLPGL